ncbi:amylovoran biosynthesis protein AmsF [Izhakiella australiensis]|uniref:Amylovoran biosynthesis protein AmsF n=1 Tax=Izhakiella australiensis TaxID=1926881 RepID=A0A1S8YKR0_9GAMM|nr:phage tailspike protein [Izhakiella australiensis]OON39701.1 amylovoran biosynthesis protein AmsF [Izhakiella australiensis]
MKRRELLQTALTSVIATLSVSSFASEAKGSTPSLSLKSVPAGGLPKDDVPILTPENLYTMPEQFWRHFEGKLYIGKAGADPTKQENWINVYLRTKSGQLSQIQQPITLNQNNFSQFINDDAALLAEAAHSMAVVDNQGQTLFNIADVTKPNASQFGARLAEPTGYQLIGEIPSIEALRHTRPLFEGAKIKLKGWHDGSEVGGGEFIGSLTAGKDDGGVIISSGGDFHWRRVVEDFNRLTLFDFGAIADGKTDAASAVKAMYAWSKSADEEICIQFPAGTFFLTGIDYSKESTRFFRVSGAMVNFGYFPATTIISDGSDDFIFNVNARWVEISNLQVNGQTDKKPNTQGFFNNKCPAGQFFRGACLRFINIGGTSLSLMDTLDCKIDQWYATHCTGDVIKSVWSDTKQGKWDHSTAIELSNFNAQYCTKGMVLNLQRCGQSIIHNGWIEHCDYPGDISNGQWIVDALSIETCKNPLIAHSSRLNMRQTNLQAGSWIDNSRDEKHQLLSPWEQGSTRVESYGIAVDGSVKYNFLTSRFRLVNNSNQASWYQLGNIWTPEVGDCWEIEILGQSGYSNGSDKNALQKVADKATTGGKAILSLQRKVHKFEGSWHVEGSSPIEDVVIVTPHDADCQVYIKLAGWVPAAGILITTNAKDRFVAGKCARFDNKMEKASPPSDGHQLARRFALHNGKAGIGANEDGDLLLASRALKVEQVDTSKPAGFISMVINGQTCAVPYFSIKS